MSFPSQSSNQGASKGSKASPPQDVSNGAEGTGSSFPSIPSKLKKLIRRGSKDCALNSELLSLFDTKKISTNINSSKASSDSQQPSSNNENPETHTEPALSQGVDGKTTFKPKDHLGNISEEECQDSTISERRG
ncbi:hypothetical protein NC653_035319 [Populus alba x Populus x berolinensis]|uniref:Uncharacterized protein n=1 Tax=Populus alba x Populus x berolinensis TaxID=444605 RepID=A0AAD6LPR4_9ROSI|nr:hypothetical protein NC653_035319 [Populus alba x Populus x berolinensis]